MIISVKHNFETAHRLPFLGGKCTNLHGHSWWVTWTFDTPMDNNGITTDFGSLKATLRGWVDENLDHGVMLGRDDPLVEYFNKYEPQQKMYVFGAPLTGVASADKVWVYLPWPTVEAVSSLLSTVARAATGRTPAEVHVQETHVNSATWRR
jgi:6-pyruvoyltetrahydropterin/6-carboxytetrahydropterin synthase